MIITCANLQITEYYVMDIFDNVDNALKFHLTVFTDGRLHFVVKEHSASDCCYWHIIIFTFYSIKLIILKVKLNFFSSYRRTILNDIN